MVDTGERSAPVRRGIRAVALEVGLVGVAGAVLTPLGVGLAVGALFVGQVGFLIAVPAVFALLVAVLSAVAKVAPDESWFTGTRGGRVFWGLVVGGVGAGLWLLGWGVGDEAGLGISRSAALWVPASVLLFALVAGVLLRRWYLALGSLAVLVVAGLLLLRALAAVLPSEVDQRLAGAHLSGEPIMVADVPGYHVLPQQRSWQLEPDGADPYPPSPFVSLRSLPDTSGPDCEVDAYSSAYPAVRSCEVDRPGLFFLLGAASANAYVHRVDGARLVLTAPDTVDREVLREGVLTARATGPSGFFTATVPGYTATSTSLEETVFTPDDRTLLPGARHVRVETRPAAIGGECLYGALDCQVESPVLRYERYGDDHGYVRTVDGLEVRVQGGLAVGKDVLRTAALAARRATDDDLLLILPPPPPTPPDHSVRAGVRELARALFGTP
ncbi:MAG TPA: hypothetical protein VNO31_07540 [Umezawaea sp.]|nr:hypothetical protein [Umezawaea sp.]